LRFLVKLAQQCDSAEELGHRLRQRYERQQRQRIEESTRQADFLISFGAASFFDFGFQPYAGLYNPLKLFSAHNSIGNYCRWREPEEAAN
jgi:hypothetical protein